MASVAVQNWATIRRARPRGRVLLVPIALALTVSAAATAAIVITATAVIALPVHGIIRWRANGPERRTDDQHPATRPPPARRRRGDRRRTLTTALQRLIAQYRRSAPSMPAPVSVYAGRYQAAIIWREQVETFAAYITKTNQAGELQAVWLGSEPGQYPTINSLAEALDSYGIGLDPASLALAHDYQHDVWDTIGACRLVGTQPPDGRHHLTLVTPNGQAQAIAPAPERDQRSVAFGPPTSLSWGPGDHRGNLETARCLLDCTDSTTRTRDQLFDDARELAVTTIRHWPPSFSVNLADLDRWTTTRTLIAHETIDPGPAKITTERPLSRPPRRRPLQTTNHRSHARKRLLGRTEVSL